MRSTQIECPVDAPVPTEFVQRLLGRTAGARRTPAELVGLGQSSLLASSRLSGTELRLGDELITMTVFPITGGV